VVIHEANSLISQDGGGLISQDGGGLISQDGGGLVASGAGNIADLKAGKTDAAAVAGNIIITGGEVDLTGVSLTGSVTVERGVLSGTGVITGDLTNNGGIISPGGSAGTLAVTGDFAQNAGGTLSLQASGAEDGRFGRLQTGGNAALGGTLELRTINGFAPLPQDPLNPVGYNSATGAFASISSNVQVAVNATGVLAAPIPNAPNPPFTLNTVVSRKTHGTSGDFDIPLTSSSNVECRTGGTSGAHTLVFTFNTEIASGDAAVTSGVGSISGAPIVSGNTMTIALTGVANAQRLTVSLNGVTNTSAQAMSATPITIGFLVGDTSGNGSVNATDIGQTKAQSGQPVSAANFRNDVTANGGAISASDISLVKSGAGTQLPTP
jgi:hypothetical protein